MKTKAKNILKLLLCFLLLGGVIGALVSLSKIDNDTSSSRSSTSNNNSSQTTSIISKNEILESLNYKYYVQAGTNDDNNLYSIRALLGISNEKYINDISITTYLKCNNNLIETKNMTSTTLYTEVHSGDNTITAESLNHKYFLIVALFDSVEANTYTIQSEIYNNNVLISTTELKTLQVS